MSKKNETEEKTLFEKAEDMVEKAVDFVVNEEKTNELAVQEEPTNEIALQEKQTPVVRDKDEEFVLSELGFTFDELDELSGLNNIDPNDFRVPYAKMYGKDTADRKKGDIDFPNGDLIHGADGEVMENVAVLQQQEVRVMFPKEYKKTNTFICRSLDGKVGAPDGKYAGRACATCPFSKFPEEGGASPCRPQRLVLATLEDGTLFHILVSGISVSPFKNSFFNGELQRGMRMVRDKYKRKIMAGANVTIGVKMETTDNGVFPALDFRVSKDMPIHGSDRLRKDLIEFKEYKSYEKEALDTAATFAQSMRDDEEYVEEETTGPNNEMF